MKANKIFASAFYLLAALATIHFIYAIYKYRFCAWHMLGVIAVLLSLAGAHEKDDKVSK